MSHPGYGGPDPFGGDPFGGNASGPFGGAPPPSGPPRSAGQQPPWGQQQPGWSQQQPAASTKANVLATLSLVFAFLFAPAGAVLGHLGLRQISRTGQPGRNRAIVGLTLSYYLITLTIVGLVGWTVFGTGSDSPVAASPTATNGAPPPAGNTTAPNSTAPSSTAPALPWPPPAGSIVAVTQEPTCQALRDINSQRNQQSGSLAGTQKSAGEWTAAERDAMNTAATAYRTAADRLAPYVAQSPNRFVQELYGQYIAYNRAFADSIANYVPDDRHYSDAAQSAFDTVDKLCISIERGQPDEYVPMVPPITDLPAPPPVDPANPGLAVAAGMAGCEDWQALSTLSSAIDKDPTQGNRYADILLDLGHRSGSPVVLELAAYGAQYLRVAALAPNDDDHKWYGITGSDVAWLMLWGCQAVDR
jgi:hypothetical protein